MSHQANIVRMSNALDRRHQPPSTVDGWRRTPRFPGTATITIAVALALTLMLGAPVSSQIDVPSPGVVEVEAIFDGSPASSYNVPCSFEALIRDASTGSAVSSIGFCWPSRRSLVAGNYRLQVRSRWTGLAIGSAVDFTVAPGATTEVDVDVTSVAGILRGSVTVDGAAPAPGSTAVETFTSDAFSRTYDNAWMNADHEGSFAAMMLAGPGQGTVYVSNAALRSFSFQLSAGQTVDIGTVDAASPGVVEVEAIFDGSPASSYNVPCSFEALIRDASTGSAVSSIGFCWPSRRSLVAGNYRLQVRSRWTGLAIGSAVDFTVAPGATTEVDVDVTSVAGILRGSVTVDGAAPAPGSTAVETFTSDAFSRTYDNAWMNADHEGSFAAMMLAGPGQGTVYVSNAALRSFSFQLSAGQTVDIGTVDAASPGVVEVEAIFDGSPASSYNVPCSFEALIRDASTGSAVSSIGFCWPSRRSLVAGNYRLQVRSRWTGLAIGSAVDFTVAPGATTEVDVDVTSVAGILRGSVTVDGAAPAPGSTAVETFTSDAFNRTYDNAWMNADHEGSFAAMMLAGRGLGTVYVSNARVGEFPFDLIRGQIVNLGAPIGNTPPGEDVEVIAREPDGSPSPVTLIFDNVVEPGTTTLATLGSGPPGQLQAPTQFKIGSPPSYFSLSTTALFEGEVEVCIGYGGVSYGNESKLNLFHFDEDAGLWVDITTSIDTVGNVICGLTESFSFFAVFEHAPDEDGDGVTDEDDNCPAQANPAQEDRDNDGLGDACDSESNGDLDSDGVHDASDNCPTTANPAQEDADEDGAGDACDADVDGDGAANDTDNCPLVANVDQADYDRDGRGDVCDADSDGDAVVEDIDQCASTPLDEIVNPTSGCAVSQLCPCSGPRGIALPWKNHGEYVTCINKTATSFLDLGLVTKAQHDLAISQAAKSICGGK